MSTFWRTLEDWTTYQDYLWFLGVLAWSGVIAAEFPRRRNPGIPDGTGWRSAFAACCIGGMSVELILLAQNIVVPYMKLDLAMGIAQAAGAGVLVWAATGTTERPARWRISVWAFLALLALGRWWWPIEAGCGLGLIQAIAILAIVRRTPDALPGGIALLLSIAPIVATHGPWAYLIGHGRRKVDWSHFALAAASTLLVAGLWLAASTWRRQLRTIESDPVRLHRLHRDLRVAVIALAGWVVCGLALAIWSGWQARQSYEGNLLHRIEIVAATLDPQQVTKALGPGLHITGIEHKRYLDGTPADVATVPHTADPLYAELRAKLSRLRIANGDLFGLAFQTLRDGEVLLLEGEVRPAPAITHIIHHHPTQVDFDRLVSGKSVVEGPYRDVWGTFIMAYVPLFHAVTGKTIGWLVGEVDGTRWSAAFTVARLQTMALIGFGVGLWTLSVAFRLRRESREIAERKAAESVAADRMKSAFLAKVSHELRTPIQSVLGYGELLANGNLREPHASWVTALHSHGTIMLRLVNDLIDMGALQSGAFRLELAPVNLRAIIDDCVAAIRPAAVAKQLTVATHLDPDLPAWVRSDGVRLRQILLNLLMNAVKFTPDGRVELSVRRQDGEIAFVVADTGPGIPADLRDQLFKPFARLDPAAAAGSGLGLALVHGLVQALGGEVRLDDSVTMGATFVAQLPLAPCPAPVHDGPAEATTAVSLSGMTVLLAEDNTLVSELLVTFLRQHGASVLTAADGIAAEQQAREERLDVLLLDIGLPGKDGIAVTEALRRSGPPGLRIVGLSAHAGPEEEARARAAGMNAFLTKPVNLATLAGVLAAQPVKTATANSIRITDPKLRATLALQFTQETPRVLADMREAAQENNWPQLRRRAHYLKNSADIIGEPALQDACQKLMALDSPPDAATMHRLLDAVIVAVPASPFAPTPATGDRR